MEEKRETDMAPAPGATTEGAGRPIFIVTSRMAWPGGPDMSRPSLKEWVAGLSEEEFSIILKQVLRDFRTEEGRAEIMQLLKDKRPRNKEGTP